MRTNSPRTFFPLFKKAVNQALATKTPDSNDIMSFKEVCKFLGLAESTIYNLVSQRRNPNSKKGKRLYFSRKSLLAWIESGQREINLD